MGLLSDIFGNFLGGGIIALIIVFQQEIRKFLLMIGSTNFASKKGFLKDFKFFKADSLQTTKSMRSFLFVKICPKTGVLIVLGKSNNLDFVKLTGDAQQIWSTNRF